MKKLLIALAILIAPLQASAATCFWVGGTGNFSDATHWSSSSGGAGSTCAATGGKPLNSGDNITMDASSGGGTVTINAVLDIGTGTMTTGAFTGTLTDAGNNVSLGAFVGGGTGVRTYNFTAAVWTLRNTGSAWAMSAFTNLTVSSWPTLITLTSTSSPTFANNAVSPLAFNDVSFTGSGATAATSNVGGTNTYRDLTFNVGSGSALVSLLTARNLSITAATCPTAGAITSTFTGNVTINASTSCVFSTGAINLTGTSGTQVVSTNGMTGNTSNWAVNNTGAGVTFDRLTTTGTFSLSAGTVTANGPMTTATFSSIGASTRAIVVTRPWTLTGTGTILTNSTSTGMTVTCTPGGYFVFSDSSTTAKTVTFSGSEILKCLKYGVGTVTNGWTVTP